MTSKTTNEQAEYCSLWRRLLAILYDAILLSAVIFCLFFLILLVPRESMSNTAFTLLRQAYLFLICYAYFVLNWKYYRQTPGMRIWKLTLISEKNRKLSWMQVNIRFISAITGMLCFAVGLLIALFRADRKCLHDLLSTTAIVRIKAQ